MRAALLVGLLAGACGAHAAAPAAPPAGTDRGVLVDQHGRPAPASRLAGRYLLVYFGYTHCPDLCPAALATMTAAVNALGPQGDAVLPLFVTVDPERDTVDVLRRYAAHFHPRLLALTGDVAAVTEAARAFGVQFRRAATRAGGDYAVDHSVFVYLADPRGRVVQSFHPQQTPAELAAAIRARLAAAATRR